MIRRLLPAALTAAMVCASSVYAKGVADDVKLRSNDAAPVQNADVPSGNGNSQTDAEKKASKLKAVTVIGSMIPQAEIETSAPSIQITADEIQARGYANVADVLRSQPLSTGQVQGNQFTNGFTPGATTISLLGLDPGFTLILINGHPMADYPLLYNGQSNFTDLSSIPVAMVDHIDILPGNQSAIYGSSAIAGVVNIVLKDNVKGITVSARAGIYTEGGGQNQRLSIVGGHRWGRLSVIGGLQLDNQKPIWGYQRSYMDSAADNPTLDGAAPVASRNVLILDPFTGYVDPGAAACTPLASGFGGTMEYSYRPGRGYYCGSLKTNAYKTFLNKSRGSSLYLNAKYDLSGGTQLYTDVLYQHNKVDFNSGPRFWYSSIDTGGYFVNANTNTFQLWQRIFAPEEIGADTNNSRQTSDSYSVTAGARGDFGNTDWGWDAYYFRSGQTVDSKRLWPLASKVETFFLGTQMGDYFGYPIYAPDTARLYAPLTQADYAGFSDTIATKSRTWTQNVNFKVVNTNLFEMPAGEVGFAALMQFGQQYWSNPTDPRVIAGDFWGLTGTQGEGKRSNYALASELRVPLARTLTANVSGRYDNYRYGGADHKKGTYKVGLEFRPVSTLLLRANYATAFRAPDMGYIFAGPSGYYTSGTDYYQCRTQYPNVPLAQCPYDSVNFSGARSGNSKLDSITAKSWGYGVVWSPSTSFDVKADFYHISIKNEVNDRSIDRILQMEANCRIGQSTGGDPYDINSALCQDILSLVHRFGPTNPATPNGLSAVDTQPINVASEVVNGAIASANWRHDMGGLGRLSVRAQHNILFKHTYKQFAGDDPLNVLSLHSYYNGYRAITSLDVGWQISDWTFNVLANRRGKTYDYAGTGTVDPWTTYNASVRYKLNDMINLSLISNNVTNKRPPYDPTFAAYPYYNVFNYNSYGRALWLQMDMHFE